MAITFIPDSHVTIVRLNHSVSIDYLLCCLQYYQPYLEEHGEGSTNEYPRIMDQGHPNTVWVSTRYMEDADYFKIKTVTLGYDFKNIWKSCPLQQLRFYVQAQNLYTFTGYTGLDPEVGSAGGADKWASGIDLGLYPPARTFLVGASIKF